MNLIAGVARAASPDGVVGSALSHLVTVYGTVAKDAAGELRHEGNRVPDIAALDANRLVVGWRAGVADPQDPNPTDQGSIMYARSGDGGATWTVGTLAAATSTYRYHYVVFLNDGGTLHALIGRITIAQDRDPGGDVNGFPVALTVKKSADGGRTWSDVAVTVGVPANDRGVVVAGKPLKHDGVWLVPYWRSAGGTTHAGVLRSTDLVTWTSGALAANPPGVAVEEPQVVVSQDDPGTLVMVARTLDLRGGASAAAKDADYRSHATYAATATSTDGGLTWSPMTLDTDIPNYYVKGLLVRDSLGRHLTVYNTLGGPFTGSSAERPEQYREVLYYKVRRPGAPWGPGRVFADGPRLTKGAARGWDVYPSADEYAPGRFLVVWEHNQTNIKVARFDMSRALAWDGAEGADPAAWTVATGGAAWNGWALDAPGTGAAEVAGGQLRLRSADGGTAKASLDLDPSKGCDFTVEFRGRVHDDSALDPHTGQGVCFGTKVANGARRLMLSVQKSGVWTMKKGSAVWEKVYTLSTAGETATWRVTVDSGGVARLARNGADTGATWVVQDSRESPKVMHWVAGTRGGNAAEARIESTRVTCTAAGLP
jgi:hypothetical protein